MTAPKTIIRAGWNFDNSFARLPELFYSALKPTPVRAPQLVMLNLPLAKVLGLDAEALQSDAGIAVLAGNRIPEGALPLSQAYAGHQFGHFTMLGDGRAHLLGEHLTPQGERFDIQLKGSGRTPYSRGGDGRAALAPMLREYIIGESMHALGIPTTRSLAVVSTGEAIRREVKLPGAMLTRVAASHLRVGTFQYAAQFADAAALKTLADYTIQRHYPAIEAAENRYLLLLQAVIKRQAELIAKWQLVGFVHGVMNTDNMTISGETIDYGPCAFMDAYDPGTVFSSIDLQGRYAYGNQPKIAAWNLARFAESLLPLLHDQQEEAIQLAQTALTEFFTIYDHLYLAGMREKLGIFNEEEQDQALIDSLLGLMQKHSADYTNTFRALTINATEMEMFAAAEFTTWSQQWQARLARQQENASSVRQLMQASNPAVIPRNHRVEEALSAAVEDEDCAVCKRLVSVLDKPYAYTAEQDEYADPPPPSACPYRTFCGT
ncbi:MAG TPA: YdiU family protein [Oscillospiraceae bacterium]|nr:YdiU family protein [Oscillospiraceae bacterium]